MFVSKMTSSRVAVLMVSTLLALGGAACKKTAPTSEGAAVSTEAQGDTIKVGEVGSMTGRQANFGLSTHNGIELAIAEINEAGGVKGKKLAVVSMDYQGKPDEAATAVTKLITQDK